VSIIAIGFLQINIVGIFWDIENVRVPHHKSTIALVEAIRRKFLQNYREAEFIVVCVWSFNYNGVICTQKCKTFLRLTL
jgi:hypothetical protein